MARQHAPVWKQLLVEIRYERGYRYLDRCGDAMLILEDALQQETGCPWLPGEAVPKGARIVCPDLDITVAMSTYHMVVDRQGFAGEIACDFDSIVWCVFSTIVGRFDLREMNRFGLRRVKILPSQNGSEEEAQVLSLQYAPDFAWLDAGEFGMVQREAEIEVRIETEDRSKGIRLLAKPATKVGVDLKVDERLKRPSHMLPMKQREALVEQLKRAKLQDTDPESGLVIDIDYYWQWPKDGDLGDFLAEGNREADKLEAQFLTRRQQ